MYLSLGSENWPLPPCAQHTAPGVVVAHVSNQLLPSPGQEAGVLSTGLASDQQPSGGDCLCQEPSASAQLCEGESHGGRWSPRQTGWDVQNAYQLPASPCSQPQVYTGKACKAGTARHLWCHPDAPCCSNILEQWLACCPDFWADACAKTT